MNQKQYTKSIPSFIACLTTLLDVHKKETPYLSPAEVLDLKHHTARVEKWVRNASHVIEQQFKSPRVTTYHNSKAFIDSVRQDDFDGKIKIASDLMYVNTGLDCGVAYQAGDEKYYLRLMNGVLDILKLNPDAGNFYIISHHRTLGLHNDSRNDEICMRMANAIVVLNFKEEHDTVVKLVRDEPTIGIPNTIISRCNGMTESRTESQGWTITMGKPIFITSKVDLMDFYRYGRYVMDHSINKGLPEELRDAIELHLDDITVLGIPKESLTLADITVRPSSRLIKWYH